MDMTLPELPTAAATVYAAMPQKPSFIFGGIPEARLQDTIRVTLVVAWGGNEQARAKPRQGVLSTAGGRGGVTFLTHVSCVISSGAVGWMLTRTSPDSWYRA